MEIVSEPDLKSAEMAYEYLGALKDILIYGGVSDCDMEKGMVRCDVNVSVRPAGANALGAKVEIKNLNSFSGVRRALEYEITRQINAAQRGEALTQETRRWDDAAGITEVMRTKEMAHDYRYFPDPDLMPFEPSEAWLEEVRRRMVELPLARKRRFMREYQLPAGDAEAFKNDVPLGDYFERLTGRTRNPKSVANWVINNLRARMAEAGHGLADLKFAPEGIVELVEAVDNGRINSKMAQEIFGEMYASGEAPEAIIQRKGLVQVSDTAALESWCDQAIADNPRSAGDYREGKAAALNFLKGQVMKLSRGKANPGLVGEILVRRLAGGKS
jgi:aspartyl-tRNA(Asn)/glutamyl-tRNA(Gln) amidotransferase subunit B